MKQPPFDRLVASVKEAGAIRRGQLKPERTTDFWPEDVQAIRRALNRVSSDDWSQSGDFLELGVVMEK